MVGSGELKAEKSKGYVFKSKSERKAFGPDSRIFFIITFKLFICFDDFRDSWNWNL
jgi:hypothetical protein